MTRIWVTIAAGFLLSGGIGCFLVPALRAIHANQPFREVGPVWHNTSKAGTPMMGGLMFIAAAIACLLGNLPAMEDYTVFYVLALALCFSAVGFLDDFSKLLHHQNEGLTSLQKAMLQMAVSALFLYVLYRTGAMDTHLYIPFLNVTYRMHPIVYIFFAMFVMVGCVNAVNLTDGVDGLSSSVTLPVMIFFTVTAMAMGKWEIAILPASLVGGLSAYLIYNWHPAKVFMGDTGSLFLGGVVCALAFALELPLVLILVGFVYICETLSVILQVSYFKATHGKRIFKMAPIHHHFELCGWKEQKIVLTFAAVSAIMCLVAWASISGLVG